MNSISFWNNISWKGSKILLYFRKACLNVSLGEKVWHHRGWSKVERWSTSGWSYVSPKNVSGPVPRSPCGRSPSLCRWWRFAVVAGSAGAPAPRGSCLVVRQRIREPVRGFPVAPACTRSRCSVEACNLSLANTRFREKNHLAPLSHEIRWRTIRCERVKNLASPSWRRAVWSIEPMKNATATSISPALLFTVRNAS